VSAAAGKPGVRVQSQTSVAASTQPRAQSEKQPEKRHANAPARHFPVTELHFLFDGPAR
jgi:hypothetical protein